MEFNLRKTSIIAFLVLMMAVVVIALILGSIQFGVRGNAASKNTISIDNSYLFASPLTGCADGIARVRITVFVLDTGGMGVNNETVDISVPAGVTRELVQNVTDSYGKAYFDVATSNPGSYPVTATVGGLKIPNSVQLHFEDASSCSS